MLAAGLAELLHFPQGAGRRLSGGPPVLREIVFKASAGVDHRNAVPFALTLEIPGGIGLVNVAVKHDGRAVLAQQIPETLKAAVGQIGLISQAGDGGVGQKNVESACFFQLPSCRSPRTGRICLCPMTRRRLWNTFQPERGS